VTFVEASNGELSSSPSAGALAANIAYFARALRKAGLPVGPGDVLDAVSAVEAGGIGAREDFYWTLHAVLVRKHEHSAVFDQAFRLFWRRTQLLDKMLATMMPVAIDHRPKAPEQASRRVQDALLPPPAAVEAERELVEIEATFTVSDAELLRAKDFEQMSADEVAAAKRALAALRIPDEEIVTRRYRPDPRGKRIDMRRSLRASLRGGVIRLERREPRRRVPPLVALCDISGSMSQYTRVFLHFLHAITAERRRVSTFLFGTRLSNITRQLAHKDPDEALAAVSKAVPDWEGGTRIAASLHAFNHRWSRRVLGQGATVLLLTDGLERDDEGLEPEIVRLAKSCRRLIWLNPLLRYDGFEPRARGIRLILPHVDEFRPVHNLKSVAELAAALAAPARAAPDRRRPA
jgi:uncharacterized protein with von Willebrand factor type A (vWA) domain